MLLVWVLCFVSPAFAGMSAVFFYIQYCRTQPDPKTRLCILAYVLALLVCAVIGYLIGLQYGIDWACSAPWGGNLCGLAGFFAIGPLAAALAIFCVGGAIVFVRGEGR